MSVSRRNKSNLHLVKLFPNRINTNVYIQLFALLLRGLTMLYKFDPLVKLHVKILHALGTGFRSHSKYTQHIRLTSPKPTQQHESGVFREI